MPLTSNTQPPVRGKIAIALHLSKSSQGVTQVQAYNAGAGTRLSAQKQRLEAKGHRFHTEYLDVPGHPARYWWIGFGPAKEASNAE